MFKTIAEHTTKLPKMIPKISQPNCAILLISPHFQAQEIMDFHRLVWNSLKPLQLIGAVVDSVNQGTGWSLTMANGTTFHSKSGKHHRAKQVGRWPTSIKSPLDSTPIFSTVSQSSQSIHESVIPSTITGLNPSAIIGFSDGEPFDLFKYLNNEFNCPKV